MATRDGNQSDRDERDRRRASEKSDDYRFADNLPDGGGTVAEREYEDYVLAERDSDGEEPDVLLDVPVVKVDEIIFEVEELRARILLQAEVLDLLKLMSARTSSSATWGSRSRASRRRRCSRCGSTTSQGSWIAY
jgi:hypothetical protein